MLLTIRRVPLGLVICGLIVASLRCSGTYPQSDDSSGLLSLTSEGTTASPKEIEMLLADIARLRLAARESFDAASVIGTPDTQLAEAREALGLADRLIEEGRAAAAAKDAQESWRKLRAADKALRQAEETAVRAGLTRIEHELVEGYAQVLTPNFGARRQLSGMVRVLQAVAHLRGGAGRDFRVVGKAREGDTLTLMSEVGEWYQVRTQEGVEGWVAKDLVTRLPGL
jgi:Bacterial SH3 domain